MKINFKIDFWDYGQHLSALWQNPHSILNTLTHLAYSLKLDGEQLKALSQNIGMTAR